MADKFPWKKGYESLEEDKPVQAKLEPEPDNDYDQRTIAVYIKEARKGFLLM